MDNCFDYETKLTHEEVYKCIMSECLYIYYKSIASKRVMHLMKYGRTERIRKKNQNRYYYEMRLFLKRRIKK